MKYIFAVSLAFILIAYSNATWNYSDNGASWGGSYPLCSSGKAQSPINIKRQYLKIKEEKQNLKTSYNSVDECYVKNTGMLQKVGKSSTNKADWGYVTYNEKKYKLLQFHYHQPSEHTFDGYRYDMELHVVHKVDDSDDFLVLGFYYNIGEENESLKKFKYDKMSSTKDATVKIEESINIYSDIAKHSNDQDYIWYVGSFTTPPCTENVNFFLFREYQTMSKAQWDAYWNSLKSLVGITDWTYANGKGTWRATQKVNGRTIM